MKSFICEYCGKHIIDSPEKYATECRHYPLQNRSERKQKAFSSRIRRINISDRLVGSKVLQER
jgi:hypothetical protein